MSIAQAARALGVSPVSISRWIHHGVGGRRLASFLLGGRRRIYVDEIRKFATSSDNTNTPMPASVEVSRKCADEKLDRLLAPRSTRRSREPRQ